MHVADVFLHKATRRRIRGYKGWCGEINDPHSCIPGLNLHVACNSLQDLSDACCSTPICSSSLPIPFGEPAHISRDVVNGLDPAQKLVRDKTYYDSRFKKLLESVTVPSDTLFKQLMEVKSSVCRVKLNPDVAAVAEFVSQDPDPYFKVGHNFWYGNTLATLSINGEPYIIHPTGYCGSTVSISCPKQDYIANLNLFEHGMDDCNPIFHVESCSDLVLLRQRNVCGIFKVKQEHSKPSCEKVCSVSSESSFIKSCFNKFRFGEFVTLSPTFTLDVYDISNCYKPKRSQNFNFVKNEDCQCTVHWHDENVVVICNPKTINFVDLRKPTTQNSQLMWNIESKTEKCESIYASAKGFSLHYVNTKHSLLSLDMRKDWIQKWSHGLPISPSLLSVKENELSEDLLLAGCSTSGYVTLVQNTRQLSSSFFRTPPYRLSSIDDTLHTARLSGHCLSPFITSRFNLTLTGLNFVENHRELRLFLQSCVGDLFFQRIDLRSEGLVRTSELSTTEVNQLVAWETACVNQYLNSGNDIKATKIVNSEEFAKLFAKGSSAESADKSTVTMKLKKQPWMMSKQKLSKFQDHLAQPLLSVWNIDDDEEWYDGSDLDENSEEGSSDSDTSD